MEDRRKKELAVMILPDKIASQKEKIEKCRMDIEAYKKEKIDYKSMDYKEQKAIREAIYKAVQANQNNPNPTEVLTYQGFKVVVPSYMVPKMPSRRQIAEESGEDVSKTRKPIPYVHLIKNGTYILEIESESGITARLNNFLENL